MDRKRDYQEHNVESDSSTTEQEHVDLLSLDIEWLRMRYELAIRHALQSAINEQRDNETSKLDLSLYTSTSVRLAMFLVKVGEIQRGIDIFNKLLEENEYSIDEKNQLAQEIMTDIVALNGMRNKSYIAIRHMAKRLLDEIVHYIDYEVSGKPNENELLIYMSALYKSALIFLWNGDIYSAKKIAQIIGFVDHQESSKFVEELNLHIKGQEENDSIKS